MKNTLKWLWSRAAGVLDRAAVVNRGQMLDFGYQPESSDVDPTPNDPKVDEWTFNQYQDEALLTADCPLIGHPVVYPLLGVVGEFGEVCEKLSHFSSHDMQGIWRHASRDGLVKELGDVLWYLAVMADRLGLKLQDLSVFDTESLTLYALNTEEAGVSRATSRDIQFHLEEMSISIGRLGERVKKVFRDGESDFEGDRKEAIVKELGGLLWLLASLCRVMKMDFSLVAHTNIQKLHSRRQRNAIRGEGDNR